MPQILGDVSFYQRLLKLVKVRQHGCLVIHKKIYSLPTNQGKYEIVYLTKVFYCNIGKQRTNLVIIEGRTCHHTFENLKSI